MPLKCPPLLCCCLPQLKDDRQHACARDATAGFVGAQLHGAEGRFDRIRGANVLPLLGGKIIKRQQEFPIFAQAFGRLGILCVLAKQEVVQRLARGHPTFSNPVQFRWRPFFAFRWAIPLSKEE